MAKLTKQEISDHNKILDLINSDKPLTFEEKWFILENYHEGATNINSAAGAFFTPIYYSRDFCLEVWGNTVIDMCAGIGSLSFMVANKYCPDDIPKQIVCVELNPEYAAIGKRIVPEADWIIGDVLSYNSPIIFDQSISNPPFGKIKTSDVSNLLYKGAEFEFKVISKASTLSKYGTFILPQMSAGFKYSGNRYYERSESTKYSKFKEQTGIELQPGIGIDSSMFKNDWKGVNIITEVCVADFCGVLL